MFPPLPNPSTEETKPRFSEKDLVRRSASTITPPEQRLTEVAKLIDVSKCIGCKACQTACIEWNQTSPEIGFNEGVYENPMDLTPDMFTLMRYSEWDNPQTGELEWLIRKDGCMHCADPGCLKACPAPGAIVQYSNGVVDFIHENCIGCGYCIKGCPFNIPRISRVDHTAYKCTLCSDRIAVGQGPACAKACPTQAIVFGTNVMYVLHHADQPELYSGLPKDPRISPVVEAWKGVTKYAGLTVLGVAAGIGFLHHLVMGPNRVSERDEENAEELTGGDGNGRV